MKRTIVSSAVLVLLILSNNAYAREWACQIHTPEGVFSFIVEEPDIDAAKAGALMEYIENEPPTMQVDKIECG